MTPQPTRYTTNSGRKMPALVVCFKCKKNVDIKKTALCCVCKNRYEPDCDGYPEQTYRLMNQDSKSRWRCKMCIRKMTTSSKDISNITMRKKSAFPTKESPPESYTKKQSPPTQDSHVLTDYDTSYETDTSPNKLSKSVDGTTTNMSTLSEMQHTIAQLTTKLESTENELENTILENNELNKQVNKLTTEIKILKSLCHSSTIIESTPIHTDKKKRHSRFSQNVLSTPSSPRFTANTNCNTDAIHSHLQQKIIILQKELQNAEYEIKTLNTQIQVLELTLMTTPKPQLTLSTETHSTKDFTSDLQQCLFEKTIAIFGAQQCVGLAAALLHSRKLTQYEKYGVVAQTMPYAYSEKIVKCCTKLRLRPEDKIVICLGENDRIVGHVLSQLKSVLMTFYKNTIIVLNVFKNNNLNVNKLNNGIKNICKYYKNCKFTDSKYCNLPDICKSINYLIDCEDYDKKFLNPVEIRKHLASSKLSFLPKTTVNEPKKGTIPFYFKSSNSGELSVNNLTSIPSEKPKKGTIPYYFHSVTKNDTFFHAKKYDTYITQF